MAWENTIVGSEEHASVYYNFVKLFEYFFDSNKWEFQLRFPMERGCKNRSPYYDLSFTINSYDESLNSYDESLTGPDLNYKCNMYVVGPKKTNCGIEDAKPVWRFNARVENFSRHGFDWCWVFDTVTPCEEKAVKAEKGFEAWLHKLKQKEPEDIEYLASKVDLTGSLLDRAFQFSFFEKIWVMVMEDIISIKDKINSEYDNLIKYEVDIC